MEQIITVTDILVEIIYKCKDITDWLNFMLTSNEIRQKIYPKFISRLFRFMIVWHTTIPKCFSESNKVIKISDNCHGYYVVTDNEIIERHCTMSQVEVYETYGIFFHALKFNYCLVKIDKIKLFDYIILNEDLMNYNFVKNINLDKLNIRSLEADESYKMSKNFIRSMGQKIYKLNKDSVNGQVNRCIRNDIHGCGGHHISTIRLKSPNNDKYCGFCGQFYTADNLLHEMLVTDGHRWYVY